ncbi:hypothetical protein [Nocardia sp. NPDC059691]|uniref:hypothetical protein n=1 Tax=unclassified Nocardia TaxID=2637762 RepID=UPI003686B849
MKVTGDAFGPQLRNVLAALRFGTGPHPGLLVEQVLRRLAGLLDEVREVRFLEVDAIRPIHDHAPGIARRDLSITRSRPDERLCG